MYLSERILSEISLLLRNGYGGLLKTWSLCLGMDRAKEMDAFLRFGRRIDLSDPESLAEKVCYLELHRPSPLKEQCTDKYSVREYIKSKGLSQILVPLIGGPWQNEWEVPLETLPTPCVLKATHGCHMNLFINSVPDRKKCLLKMHSWLRNFYGSYSMEPHYLNIPHRIYAETFLHGKGPLKEYKFHCLNGIPQFILTCTDRNLTPSGRMCVTLDTYDTNWRPLPVMRPTGNISIGNGDLPRSETLESMLSIAKTLSSDFDFVRVDLLVMDEKIYFGELTFTPACGIFPYYTETFLHTMGKLLTFSPA